MTTHARGAEPTDLPLWLKVCIALGGAVSVFPFLLCALLLMLVSALAGLGAFISLAWTNTRSVEPA